MVRAADVYVVPMTVCKRTAYSGQFKERRQREGRTCQGEGRPLQRPRGKGSAACSSRESKTHKTKDLAQQGRKREKQDLECVCEP